MIEYIIKLKRKDQINFQGPVGLGDGVAGCAA